MGPIDYPASGQWAATMDLTLSSLPVALSGGITSQQLPLPSSQGPCGREGGVPSLQTPSYTGAQDTPSPSEALCSAGERGWGANPGADRAPAPQIAPDPTSAGGQTSFIFIPLRSAWASAGRERCVPSVSPEPGLLVAFLSLQGTGRGMALRRVPGCRAEVRASPPGLRVIHIKQWAPLFLPALRAHAGLSCSSAASRREHARGRPAGPR